VYFTRLEGAALFGLRVDCEAPFKDMNVDRAGMIMPFTDPTGKDVLVNGDLLPLPPRKGLVDQSFLLRSRRYICFVLFSFSAA
jgi:hypothetical protein